MTTRSIDEGTGEGSVHYQLFHVMQHIAEKGLTRIFVRACSQKHREEVTKLKQELSGLQSSSKGGQQAVDRTKKDLEKTRCPSFYNTAACVQNGKKDHPSCEVSVDEIRTDVPDELHLAGR
jgi:hypothetical protein